MSFKRWLNPGDSSAIDKDKTQPPALPTTLERTPTIDDESHSISVSPSVDSKNHTIQSHLDLSIDKNETLDEQLNVDKNYPYGDGSNKVFGMENFGYTCYCNSVVQCLFYTRDFRLQIIKYPLRDEENNRERKWETIGLKPHHLLNLITTTSDSLNSNANTDDSKTNPVHPGKNKLTLARRTSNFFGRGKKSTGDETEDPTDDTNNNDTKKSTSSTNSTGSVVTSSNNNSTLTNNDSNTKTTSTTTRSNSNNNSLQPNTNGMIPLTIPRDPNSSVLIGKTADPNASIDSRKKAALIQGPILNLDHSLNTYDMKESLLTSLKDLFESIIENKSKMGVISPSYLIETLKRENELFRSTMHQDAHEFLNFLLNDVIDTLNDHLKVKRNCIHGIFEGFLTNQTKCLTCENITSRDETFLDLSIDLSDNQSIQTCLKQFSASEMLTGSNKFYCDNCHSLQEAEKRMGIKKLPKILALHLKRFEYSEEHQRMVKLFHKIQYPLYMKLESDIPTDNSDDDWKFYKLYGVVVHIGGGPHHGHYVALVHTALHGWLLFDDETVEQITESYVLKFVGDPADLATAYVLFYQEITEEEYNDWSEKNDQTVEGGFNSNFSFSQDTTTVNTEDKDIETEREVSPLDKVPEIASTEASIHSSLPSNSSKTLPNSSSNTPSSSEQNPHLINIVKPAKAFTGINRLKSKNSVSQISNSTVNSDPSSEKSTSQDSGSGVPSQTSAFWRRESKTSTSSNNNDSKSTEKEKKKNRMSMSFGFKRGG